LTAAFLSRRRYLTHAIARAMTDSVRKKTARAGQKIFAKLRHFSAVRAQVKFRIGNLRVFAVKKAPNRIRRNVNGVT